MITCPFCGSKDIIPGEIDITKSYFLFQDFHVHCKNCGSNAMVRVTWDRVDKCSTNASIPCDTCTEKIVHCSECVNWNILMNDSEGVYFGNCELTNHFRNENDYCSYGELRKDEVNV